MTELKSIWHKKTEHPEKLLHCTRLIVTKWGCVYDEKAIDNGAFIETEWAYLDDLLACEKALIDTKKKLDMANERVDMYMGLAAYAKKHIDGLNSMLESWYKLLQSDKDTATKYAILKSAISAYVENNKEQIKDKEQQ